MGPGSSFFRKLLTRHLLYDILLPALPPKDLAQTMSIADRVLAVLADVSEVDEVRRNLELRLYDLDILDSLKTVELIVAFSEKLGVEVSPAELEREQWATPSKIVTFMEDRLRQ
jgi:D-alanine--poly(phosphoribitol) ligase subunit 2